MDLCERCKAPGAILMGGKVFCAACALVEHLKKHGAEEPNDE